MENDYKIWAWDLMNIIMGAEVSNDIKAEEVKAVLNGTYEEQFTEGDTPEEAWDGEMDAIKSEAEPVEN